MICLGRPEDAECDILKLLDVLLSNEIAATEKQRVLQNDFGIPMTRELEGGLRDMCNLGEVIARENMAKGMAQGRTEGREEMLLFSIRNLIKNTGWSLEQAMKTLGVPQEEWPQFSQLIADP